MLLDLTKLYWPSKTFVSFELKSQKTGTYQILTFIFLHDSDYQNQKSKVKKHIERLQFLPDIKSLPRDTGRAFKIVVPLTFEVKPSHQ